MTRFELLLVTLSLVLVAACGGPGAGADDGGTPILTAASLGTQELRSPAEYLAEPRYAGADLENGANQAQICRACHTLEQGGMAMLGPNLYGMFGQPAGKRPGFEFSPALAEADFAWTPRALEAWLEQPARFLPGNRMSYAGLADADRRADLVAYLLTVTSAPAG